MASIQKLSLLLGKTLKDRQGNKYRLLSILLAPDGSPGKLVFENQSGMRSQRLPSGLVRAGATSPRDILLRGATRQRRAFNEWSTFGGDVDGYDSDQFEDGSPFRSPISFDDDDEFFTPRRKKRARFGSYESPFTDDEGDDTYETFEGPNLQRNSKGELEITIKVKGLK